MLTAESIQHDLQIILSNFQGREFYEEITIQTMFFADLGMTSIDAVVLGETLQSHYGRTLPFAEFLSALAARRAEDLSVGELVEFLVQSLNT